MEHPGEVWQEFDYTGERLGGIDPADSTMGEDSVKLFGGAAIMLYRYKDGEVEFLFQHRSKKLLGNPDKWDVSAGGHTNLDEPILDTAVRESWEEIGAEIEKEKLEFAASYLRWKVIVNLFFYDWSKNEDTFHFDDGEVEEVRWIKYSEFSDFRPNLKRMMIEDEIFMHYLNVWNEKILAKYENN